MFADMDFGAFRRPFVYKATRAEQDGGGRESLVRPSQNLLHVWHLVSKMPLTIREFDGRLPIRGCLTADGLGDSLWSARLWMIG